MNELFSEQIITWVIIPLLIFVARIMDVSIGTLRLIFIARGYRWLAPLLGFIEVIIWLLAIRQILQHLDNWMCYIAYGLGFAAGNFIGMVIDHKLSLGKIILRVILKVDSSDMANALRDNGFGVTELTGQGKSGPVRIIFSTMRRKSLPKAIETIRTNDPNAFYTVEEVSTTGEGYFRQPAKRAIIPIINPFSFWRKGK